LLPPPTLRNIYANGDYMKAVYNILGQMISEKWYDRTAALTAHYKYAYDSQSNIVRSVDIVACKEYNYSYEEGRLLRTVEYDITVSAEGITTSKTRVCEIRYTYDAEGEMIRKRIIPVSGTEQVIYYESDEGKNTVVKFTAGGNAVTSHSKNDSFGRKVFDELQLGSGYVSRQFLYYAGQSSQTHEENAKLKSTPTTNLVSQLILSDGRTLSYEYDAEERITKVIDSVDGTTEYTYDALGQLLTEKVNDRLVNTMTYDNYGNILTKNGKSYTYDEVWKDKLSLYGGLPILYDHQGNPTTYLGHTLTWEKGRQLKSFDSNTYTYNANGIRTSKTVNGVKHTYTLDGVIILRETWGDNTLIPLYDNEDSVCGILYNDTPYYFLKNLQGDIIAITNQNGQTIAKYRYDAWGKCTVTSDTSGSNISGINPFRYRGYYYDPEIGMYYLQSRYYAPEIGRFVNADDARIFTAQSKEIGLNAFEYCDGNPVNSIDVLGQLGVQLAARIALGVMIGFYVQLLSELIALWFAILFDKKRPALFADPGDYVSSMISWALTCVSFNKKVLEVVATILPVFVKQIGRIFNKSFDWIDFAIDIAFTILSFVVSKCLKNAEKK